MTQERDEFRRRAIRAALIVAGIAAVMGLVIGALTAVGVYVTGVIPEGEDPPTIVDGGSKDENSIPSPSLSPTGSPSPSEAASEDSEETGSAAGAPSASPSTSPSSSPSASPSASLAAKKSRSREPRQAEAITLRASTSQAESYEDVVLSGRYPGGNGTTLQVQRREGGSWAAFPTSATVGGGVFRTFVASGQPGRNEFRVVDPSSGRASNVVAFTVS